MSSWSALFTRGKYPELDGLRAGAILLVLFTHIFQTIPGLSFVAWHTEWATPLFNGWIGVDLFFVLSGFLVGGQILRGIEAGSFSLRNFYWLRTFRILPAYYFVLICFFVLWKTAPDLAAILQPNPLSYSAFAKNFLLITDYFPANAGVGSWSLSIEEHFYLVIPCLLLLVARWPRAAKVRLFFGIAVAALLMRALSYRYFHISDQADMSLVLKRIYFPFHTRMDALAAGVLAYLLFQDFDSSRPSLLPGLARRAGLLATAFVALTGALKGGWLESTLQYSLLAGGFASLLWGVLTEPHKKESRLCRFLSWSIWVPVARLSYSIYLWHLLIIHFFSHFTPYAPGARMFLAPLLMLSFSFFVPLLQFLFLENPIHAWSKRRSDRWRLE